MATNPEQHLAQLEVLGAAKQRADHSRKSSQQDQLRNRIRATPHEAILFISHTKRTGILQAQAEHQKACFTTPFVHGMLSDPFKERPLALTQVRRQPSVTISIFLIREVAAKRVAGGDE